MALDAHILEAVKLIVESTIFHQSVNKKWHSHDREWDGFYYIYHVPDNVKLSNVEYGFSISKSDGEILLPDFRIEYDEWDSLSPSVTVVLRDGSRQEFSPEMESSLVYQLEKACSLYKSYLQEQVK